MISAFVSESEDRGFGIHISAEDWTKIEPIRNKYHELHEWFDVPDPDAEGRRQIGICVFEYGGRKTKNDSTNDDALTSGWWTGAKFQVQLQFVLECFEALYNGTRQLLVQVDRSSGHMTKGPDARVATNINFTDGGVTKGEARKGFDKTTVNEEDFGDHLPRDGMRVDGMIDPTNPVQYGNYPAQNDPSRYDNAGPRYDRTKDLFKFLVPDDFQAGQELEVRPLQNAPPVRCTPPAGATPGDELSINLNEPGSEWWRGLQKGKAQLLFETGHIDPSVSKPGTLWMNSWASGYNPSAEELARKTHRETGKKNAEMWLAERHDFRNQPTLIERNVLAAGHLLIASPRYHPEMAGLGIEYCWGKAKWCYRRYINDLEGKHLQRNILIALSDRPYNMHGATDGEVCPAPLPVHRVRMFARRARTYRMLFDRFPNREAADAFVRSWKEGKAIAIRAGEEDIILDSADKDDGFADMIEKMYKTVKTHCNIIDVDWHVCTQE